MTFLAWMALVGGLLLLMALSSSYLKRVPVSTSFIYLIIGIIISPLGFGVVAIDFESNKVFFEHLTEIAVIISLFVGGLKLRLPLKNDAWKAAYQLAFPVMFFSIVGIAVFAHFVFGFGWATAILLGALLAPTDPVLASAVSVENANDNDRMRYGLSGEAGFNDGMAFPFVVFGLLLLEHNNSIGSWIGGWALHRLVWAVPAGLLLGYGLGLGVGYLAIKLRNYHKDSSAPNDFLALALITLAYVFAEWIGAWGFLAVFAAGLGLRSAEIKIVEENPIDNNSKFIDNLAKIADEQNQQKSESDDESSHTPAENVIDGVRKGEAMKEPAIAAGVVVSEAVSFGNTVERLAEVFLVMIVGICFWNYWDWRAIPLALVFFFVIRPVLTQIFLLKTPTDNMQRWLLGWFGIRGIGSIYYLAYALNHGLQTNANDLISLVISIIALSISVHGLSAQPILKKYENSIKTKEKDKNKDAK